MNDEEIEYTKGFSDEVEGENANKNKNNEPIVDQGENTISLDDDGLSDMTYVESTEDGEALSSKDFTKKLREELKVLRKEKEEYLTGWQRAKADYVNLQKELESVRMSSSVIAKEKMANNLMPALDSFDMAFSNKEAWEKVDKNWRVGVEYIYSQFMTGLANSGIEKIDQIGVPFDPSLHHSISAVPTEKESQDHTIESIIQVGYRIGERVIRPARVNIYEHKS